MRYLSLPWHATSPRCFTELLDLRGANFLRRPSDAWIDFELIVKSHHLFQLLYTGGCLTFEELIASFAGAISRADVYKYLHLLAISQSLL